MRKKLKRTFLTLLLLSLVTAAWGFWIEPGRLVVRHVSLEIAGWTGETRIAAVSDVHAGSRRIDLQHVREIVDRINAEQPELIVFTGDFVIGGPRGRGSSKEGGFIEPEQTAAELKRLRAPLGVYAVLGNHDWWWNGERVSQALSSSGLRVLENEAVRISEGFWLGGIADLWTREPDVPATLAQVTDSAPVVLFTHNPDIFPDVPERAGLLIAGHTHGGQVHVPFWGPVIATSMFGYNDGHFVDGRRQLYVTTGIGTSIVGVRFLVPPEIVIFTVAAPRT